MCLQRLRRPVGRAPQHRPLRRPGQSLDRVRPPRALTGPGRRPWVVFDLDGTLLDSDAALLAPFVELGIPAEDVAFGPLLAAECARLGLSVGDYLARYDVTAARPFPGVADLLAGVDRWAVCSNKVSASGRAELARLGWEPALALFAEDFGGRPKVLGPVLEALSLAPDAVVFVGDTAHDRHCAAEVGCAFALAGWNPRALPEPGDTVLSRPADVLPLLADAGGRRRRPDGREEPE